MRSLFIVLFGFASVAAVSKAAAIPISFTQLTGVTGGSPANTAVYRADLSSLPLTSIRSITIADSSFGLGGAPGQFSGFDLDAIKLSTTNCSTAACAASLSGLGVFDFSPAGTIFKPGAQRPPTDPKLFGTGPSGTTVDNSVATLGVFDGNSTTLIPGAFGSVSMGDGGILTFNLTSAVSPSGLRVYIGEVGNNGEVAAGTITVSDTIAGVPEPSSVLLVGGGLAALVVAMQRRANRRRPA